MATLLKWAQSTQVKLNGIKNSGTNTTNGDRKWIHPPEALQKGHIAYLVKFLGNMVVDQPKGIEVVKEGIRKLRFAQQLRKSETGAKTRKVELTISIDGVAIQEPRTHVILHQFPLHRISYCADDKGEKKFFSFIAKQPNQVDNDAEDTHECFVFISDKLAEEITLTIGQAFELAYKRFLDTSGKDLESQRRAMITQQTIKRLEQENNTYRQRLLELSQFNSISKAEMEHYLRKNQLKNVLEIPSSLTATLEKQEKTNGNSNVSNLVDFNSDAINGNAPPIPPRALDHAPAVGTKLEGLLLHELDPDDDFDPRSFAGGPPLLAPPPKAARRAPPPGADLFGAAPFPAAPADPFEMGDFGGAATSQDIEHAIGLLDRRILEMRAGFSRGISFGNDDFSIESLDPLKN